jgi:hypothetical protein
MESPWLTWLFGVVDRPISSVIISRSASIHVSTERGRCRRTSSDISYAGYCFLFETNASEWADESFKSLIYDLPGG